MKALLAASSMVLLCGTAGAASIAGFLSPASMAWSMQFDHKLQYALITPPEVVAANWNDEALSPGGFASNYASFFTGDAVTLGVGDANGDGKTTVIDYLAVGQYFMFDSTMPAWLAVDGEGVRPADCDFNQNGFVDIFDAGTILSDIVSEGYIVVCTNTWPEDTHKPKSGTAAWSIELTMGCSTGVIRQYGMRDADFSMDTACFAPGHVLISGRVTPANDGAFCGIGAGCMTITSPGGALHSGYDLQVAYSEDGSFAKLAPVAPGTYDVLLTRPGALVKRLANVVIDDEGVSGLEDQFWFGDIDGDNAVTVFDYNVLSEAFDIDDSMPEFYEPMNLGFKPYDCDLDHDGVVSVYDYGILSDSWDKEGE